MTRRSLTITLVLVAVALATMFTIHVSLNGLPDFSTLNPHG